MSAYREKELENAQAEISEMRRLIQSELEELRHNDVGMGSGNRGNPSQQSFDELDRNHDGVIDRAEYEAGQQKSRELEAALAMSEHRARQLQEAHTQVKETRSLLHAELYSSDRPERKAGERWNEDNTPHNVGQSASPSRYSVLWQPETELPEEKKSLQKDLTGESIEDEEDAEKTAEDEKAATDEARRLEVRRERTAMAKEFQVTEVNFLSNDERRLHSTPSPTSISPLHTNITSLNTLAGIGLLGGTGSHRERCSSSSKRLCQPTEIRTELETTYDSFETEREPR